MHPFTRPFLFALGLFAALPACRQRGAVVSLRSMDEASDDGALVEKIVSAPRANGTLVGIEPTSRSKDESAAAAHARWLARKKVSGSSSETLTLAGETVRDRALSTAAMQVSAPVWPKNILQRAFEAYRDTKLQGVDLARPNWGRRLTWLYPDEGCYVRAALAEYLLGESGFPAAGQVFVFGDLSVATNNSPDGRVYWSYHVAPIVTVNNTPYVLDPAIDPKKPLTLRAWVEKQATWDSVTLSFCDAHAVDTDGACIGAEDQAGGAIGSLQTSYFDLEWDRQGELGRDPEVVLGASPPWLSTASRP